MVLALPRRTDLTPGVFLFLFRTVIPKDRGNCKSINESPPPWRGRVRVGGDCHEISMLQFHPPPNPLPSREGGTYLEEFCNWLDKINMSNDEETT